MGFSRVRGPRVARTVDGGYIYRGMVYRRQRSDWWELSLPDGTVVEAATEERVHRKIDRLIAADGAA